MSTYEKCKMEPHSIKRIKKMILSAVCIMMLFMVTTATVSAEDVNTNITNKTDININKIEELLDKRAELLLTEKDAEQAEAQMKELNRQLEEQGARQVSYSESKEDDAIVWFSYTQEYSYNGTVYEVATLTAQPGDGASCLSETGRRFVTAKKSWAYSFMFRILNQLSAWGLPVNPPGDSTVYFYDCITTVAFQSVKEKGAPDDNQKLVGIFSKCKASVWYQYPSYSYEGDSVEPEVIQGAQILDEVPDKYGNTDEVIQAYTESKELKACVKKMKIYGPEGRGEYYIHPVIPKTPEKLSYIG